jgi:hypothetical protein
MISKIKEKEPGMMTQAYKYDTAHKQNKWLKAHNYLNRCKKSL